MSDSVALTHLDPSFNSANPTYSGVKPVDVGRTLLGMVGTANAQGHAE